MSFKRIRGNESKEYLYFIRGSSYYLNVIGLLDLSIRRINSNAQDIIVLGGFHHDSNYTKLQHQVQIIKLCIQLFRHKLSVERTKQSYKSTYKYAKEEAANDISHITVVGSEEKFMPSQIFVKKEDYIASPT